MSLLPSSRLLVRSSALLLLTSACGRDAGSTYDDAGNGDAAAQPMDGAVAAQAGGGADGAVVYLDAGGSMDAGILRDGSVVRDAASGGAQVPSDSGAAGGGGADSASQDAAPTSPVPAIDCGFVDWNTPFPWTPTSVGMSVFQTKANSAVERYIGSPEVIDRGDLWDMFYAMSDEAKVGRIGHATSSDRGRTWTRSDALLSPYGSYASGFLDTPTALYEDGRYRVYLFGNSTANVAANPNFPTPGGQIGEVSLAGTQWSFPSPELSIPTGPKDAWDGLWVESPVVKRVGSQYFMWYTANDASWTVRHGVATSADGKTWEKFQGNPVVSPSTDNTRFDSFFPGGPGVVQAPDGTFLMFFACAARASAALPPLIANVCLATSPAGDGKTFHLVPSDTSPAPIIPRSFFEGLSEGNLRVVNGPINPSVVLDRELGVFKLYYENQSSHIGLITLPVCQGM
jgi:hypothetical protein